MPEEARLVLAQLIQTRGRDLALDPRRLRAVLADLLPGAAEAKRLVAAAEEGVPAQILASPDDPTGAVRLQLVRRLEQDRDMTPEAAGWTVDAWAMALGSSIGSANTIPPDANTLPAPRTPDDDAPPPTSRKGLLVLGAVASAVAVAAIAFVALGGEGNPDETATPRPSDSASASVSIAATPSQAEAPTATPDPTPTPQSAAVTELLSWIPSAFSDTCEESTDLDGLGPATARVDCELRGTAGASFILYDRLSDLRDEYETFLRSEMNTGSCSDGVLPSENGWSYEGKSAGRFTCFRDGSRAWVVWSTNYANILAWISREDGGIQRLYKIWRDDAGPVAP